jgi:hypothetical protein
MKAQSKIAALLLCLATLTGCPGEKKSPASASAPPKTTKKEAPAFKGEPGLAGVEAVLSEFVKPDADLRALTMRLRPRSEDYAKIFVGQAVERAKQYYEPRWKEGKVLEVWGKGDGLVAPGEGEVAVGGLYSASTETLRTGVESKLPGGYRKVASHLQPGLTFFVGSFVKVKGGSSGTRVDGLVRVDGRWVLVSRPWLALKGLSSAPIRNTPKGPAKSDLNTEALKALKEFVGLIEAKKLDQALQRFPKPPTMNQDAFAKSMTRLLKNPKLLALLRSIAGDAPKVGPYKSLFSSAGSTADLFGVKVTECYAFASRKGEIAFHWDGKRVRFLRFKPLRYVPSVAKFDGPPAPSKAWAIEVLRRLLTALEGMDWAGAIVHVSDHPKASPAEFRKAVQRWIPNREITRQGHAILHKSGTFGPLQTVFPERAERWASAFGKPVGECYALTDKRKRAEVAFHWNGKALRIIRLDDAGKIR